MICNGDLFDLKSVVSFDNRPATFIKLWRGDLSSEVESWNNVPHEQIVAEVVYRSYSSVYPVDKISNAHLNLLAKLLTIRRTAMAADNNY